MKQLIRAAISTLLCGVIISATLTACEPAREMDHSHTGASTTEAVDYYCFADSLALIEVVDSPDLTDEMLESRNGKLLIERVIGEVLDDKGNGMVYGVDPDYNYISYRYVEGANKGDVVCSYFVYNPDSNGVDDVVARYDYVIDNRS